MGKGGFVTLALVLASAAGGKRQARPFMKTATETRATIASANAASFLPFGRAGRAVVLAMLAVALLLPIWTVHYVPLVDYPNHLAGAFVLAHLKDPAFHFSRFYSADWNTYPYLAMDWILVGLQTLFSIDVAGRLLLSLAALGVPAAAWFFLRRANPGEETLAFWALLIAENLYFFQYGFINMQLSLALCLVALGLWVSYLERPRWPAWSLLLLLTTTLYFTHLMGFGVAGLVMTAYAVFARRPLRQILLSWALFVPGALFFLHSQAQLHSPWQMQFRGLGAKVSGLLSLVVGASPAIDFLTLAAIVVAAVVACSGNRELRWNRAWLAAAGALFLLYWIFPAKYAQGMNADRRLLPFLFVIALAGARVGRRGKQLALLAVLLFLLRTGMIESRFVSQQPRLAQMAASFAAIPPNARVLPLVGWQGGSPSVERNFWAYGVIERGWLAPTLFHDPGVQPLELKAPVYNPYQAASFGPLKKTIDWNRVRTDYDYIWAYDISSDSASLSAIAKPVFEIDRLGVFRIAKAARPTSPPRMLPAVTLGHRQGETARP